MSKQKQHRQPRTHKGDTSAAHAESDGLVRQLRDELRLRERRMHAVLEAAVNAVITIDTAGRIESFNNAAERMFGWTAAEAIGQNVSVLMGKPHRDRHDDYIRHYLETGEARAIGRIRHFTGQRKDGTEFPVQVAVSEIDSGLFIGIVRDVTEQHALQEEVVRVATLEQRHIARELHDSTQQELTGLGLLAGNLADQLCDSKLRAEKALAEKIAAGIAETNQHLRQLCKGLMPVPVNASELLAALDELARSTERDFGIRCELVCDAQIDVVNDSAAAQLYYIVREALTNAIKHSGADTLSINANRTNGTVKISVTDNGVGISDQADNSTGLGLRIMAHRCEMIGGTFSVRQRESRGTVVTCHAPVASDD
jgi:PAS domain S-box-containing protein